MGPAQGIPGLVPAARSKLPRPGSCNDQGHHLWYPKLLSPLLECFDSADLSDVWRHNSGDIEARRVIHVRLLFGNKMRLIQLQVSVSTYCYHPGSNGPGSEKPWIDSTFA